MGGRTVAASGLSLLGYFPLHIVLQEREEGGRKVGGRWEEESNDVRQSIPANGSRVA